MKKVVLILCVLLFGFLVWGLIQSSNISVAVNGQELSSPMKAVISAWGLLVAIVVLFCVAILLTFVLAGASLLFLGFFVMVGVVLSVVSFPFLLPLLLPLVIVWVFILGERRGKKI
jgi:predicted exporter